MELVTGTAALALLGKVIDIISKLNKFPHDAAVSEKAIELHGLIISLQKEIFSIQSEYGNLLNIKNDLEKECMRLHDWSAEKENYTRIEIASGVFAYIEKNFMGNIKNAHKYCCNCFDNQKKSTLQHFIPEVGRRLGLSCHNGCPDLIFLEYKELSGKTN